MATSCPDPRTRLLVIGYGNTLRGDDGVGPRVAEAVEELELPGVRTLIRVLLTPELAEPISQAHSVIFVDASLEPSAEVQLRALAPAASSQVIAHAAAPSTLLALARDVFGHTPKAWLLTIPAENLEIGEELSAKARGGFARAVERITEFARR